MSNAPFLLMDIIQRYGRNAFTERMSMECIHEATREGYPVLENGYALRHASNRLEWLSFVVEQGADLVKERDRNISDGLTPALTHDCMRYLVERNGHTARPDEWLRYAIKFGYVDSVKIMLEKGVLPSVDMLEEVLYLDTCKFGTGLARGYRQQLQRQIFSLLLEHGANLGAAPNVSNELEATAWGRKTIETYRQKYNVLHQGQAKAKGRVM